MRTVATGTIVVAGLPTVPGAIGLARLVAVRCGRNRVQARQVPLWLLWLGLTVALAVRFRALHSLEIVLKPHHPAGVAGVFGDGGRWALPAAAAIGALPALITRCGRTLVAVTAGDDRARAIAAGRGPQDRRLPDRPRLRGLWRAARLAGPHHVDERQTASLCSWLCASWRESARSDHASVRTPADDLAARAGR